MSEEDWTVYRQRMADETGRDAEQITEAEVWDWCVAEHKRALAELPPRVELFSSQRRTGGAS